MDSRAASVALSFFNRGLLEFDSSQATDDLRESLLTVTDDIEKKKNEKKESPDISTSHSLTACLDKIYASLRGSALCWSQTFGRYPE